MRTQGVIHDIGYRHYDGPRLGRAAITRALTWHSFRSAFGLGRGARAKIVPVAALAVLALPAVISAALSAHGDPRLFGYESYVPELRTLVIILFAAAQAPELVSRDIRSKVLPLYFARPARPVDYPLAKYLAFSGACLVLIESPLLVMYIGTVASLHGGKAVLGETRMFAAGLGIGAIWAVTIAAFALTGASITGRRAFASGGVAIPLVLSYTMAELLILIQGGNPFPHTSGGWAAGLLSPFTLLDGVRLWLAGNGDTPDQAMPPGFTGSLYALVLATLTAAALAALSSRYRKASLG
jgi:ABC-2 type transport system permease protein